MYAVASVEGSEMAFKTLVKRDPNSLAQKLFTLELMFISVVINLENHQEMNRKRK